MKTVTVIIPIYNMEKYLEQCLQSVLNQTLRDFEVICINDGSTDNSITILQNYQKKYEFMHIVNQKNQGVSSARNAGLKMAEGEFVCFMDPDDFYPDEYVLEELYNGAKENKVLICGGSFCRYNDKTQEKMVDFDGFYEKYTFTENKKMNYREYQYDYGYHRFIYSLQMLRENGIVFPPYRRFQDPPFFVKSMICAGEFFALSRITYCYRVGHQKINWNEERVTAFFNGVCDNLKISSENELENLHAVTVQRIIEQKRAIETNKIEKMSERYQRAFFNMLILIREDLIEKSDYQINMEKVFYAFKNSLLPYEQDRNEMEKLKQQYTDIKNSNIYKIGKIITYVPRRIKDKFLKS